MRRAEASEAAWGGCVDSKRLETFGGAIILSTRNADMWIYQRRDVRIPIHLWADSIEDSALEQAKALANLPFAVRVAVMADAHLGYGMPVGAVLATENEILPYGVGGDIGCGMLAVQVKLEAGGISKESLASLRRSILTCVPVGNAARGKDDPVRHSFTRTELYDRIRRAENAADGSRVLDAEKIAAQMGTLGGGNHFIELQTDEEGWLWVMLHSGSRHMGQQVVRHYHSLARDSIDKDRVKVPKELAFLRADSEQGRDYLAKMELALAYATANREAMAETVLRVLSSRLGALERGETVHIHHNYAARERHFGRELWVHRKGATFAGAGAAGIVPGSMGTPSYIVEGKGEPASLQSCSHGAGRVLGRAAARRTLSVEVERRRLRGIIHGLDDTSALDEAPGAYKDIESVIAAQSDLITPRHRLLPIASIKG